MTRQIKEQWLGIPEKESFVVNSPAVNNVIVLDSDICKYLICCFAQWHKLCLSLLTVLQSCLFSSRIFFLCLLSLDFSVKMFPNSRFSEMLAAQWCEVRPLSVRELGECKTQGIKRVKTVSFSSGSKHCLRDFKVHLVLFPWHCDLIESTRSCQGDVLRGEWQQGYELSIKAEGRWQLSMVGMCPVPLWAMGSVQETAW